MFISVVGRRPVHREHLAAGLGAARSSRSACGASSRSSSARSTRRSSSTSWCSRTSSRRSSRTSTRNIAATRDAFGLDKRRRRSASTTTHEPHRSQDRSATTSQTIDNARLWDPRSSRSNVPDAARACRPTTSSPTSTSTATRSTASSAQVADRRAASSTAPTCRRQSWVNQHLVYTHGYGVGRVAGQRGRRRRPARTSSSATSRRRRPSIAIELDRSREVYFGEGLGGYVVVDAKQPEFNYADGRAQRPVHPVRGQGRRRALELRCGGPRSRCASATSTCSISGQITTRHEDPLPSATSATGCRSAAPFLEFDADPYPVVARRPDRRGCSTATRRRNRYPYSQSHRRRRAAALDERASTTCATR